MESKKKHNMIFILSLLSAYSSNSYSYSEKEMECKKILKDQISYIYCPAENKYFKESTSQKTRLYKVKKKLSDLKKRNQTNKTENQETLLQNTSNSIIE